MSLIMISTFFIVKKSYAIESTYEGFEVVGNIEIPKIAIDLPILKTVSTSSLKTSVALLYTSAGINEVGNTVITGHNLLNDTLFSNLSKLENGDYIKITDMDDNIVNYKVYKTEITTPEDTSYFNKDTNGKKEITLATATDDSSGRFLVFATETTEIIDDSNKENVNEEDKDSNKENANDEDKDSIEDSGEKENDNKEANNVIENNNKVNNNDDSTAKTTLPKAEIGRAHV